MAAWTPLLNSIFLVGKPTTSPTGLALRDNPIAIAEGASSAPYTAAEWHPYNGVSHGDGATGAIYDFAVHGAVASFETPNFVDGFEYRILINGLSHNAASGNLTFEVFRETSGSYAASHTMLSMAGAIYFAHGHIEILRPRDVRASISCPSLLHSTISTNATVSAAAAGAFFTYSTAQKITKARVGISSGTFDAGSAVLLKRRVQQ